jgi:uncharacterized SAM-binding protein YcdF (DUF218 family)
MKLENRAAITYLPHGLIAEGRPGDGESRFLGAFARGVALFLGTFCFLNLFVRARSGVVDPNLWWIDLRWLPSRVAFAFLLLSSALLVAFALKPPAQGWRKLLTACIVGVLAVAALFNAAGYYLLLARHDLLSGFPVALSLIVLAGLCFVATFLFQQPTRRSGGIVPALAVCLCLTILFPLAQMLCFGKTDYRRPADAVVVPGARVYASGNPSDALTDRVRTACDLYRRGLVSKLIFSGGPGDGQVSEPEAMRRIALQMGVKPDAILLDEQGLNTRATAKNVSQLLGEIHASRVLVVSHFYHLPRVKLAFQKEGREIFTVPAREPRQLRFLPYYLGREVVAQWVYYFRLMK